MALLNGDRAATAILAMIVALPVLYQFGLFDPWPAWAVYVPQKEQGLLHCIRPSVVYRQGMHVFPEVLHDLDERVYDVWKHPIIRHKVRRLRARRWFAGEPARPSWVPARYIYVGTAPASSQRGIDFNLSRWSIKTLGVPLYPDVRAQYGAANVIVNQLFYNGEYWKLIVRRDRGRFAEESQQMEVRIWVTKDLGSCYLMPNKARRRGLLVQDEFPERASRFVLNPYPRSTQPIRLREQVGRLE
ncbi:hypothetical protein [Stratiformator vulcanicus]|uniref:Uncharacterized protein n=1 Tax=Stratiformator vulcanicus TaxID=2527980 RepID=A0A517R723_9PLAN|nr:hypothetical protein [Stratiformator vulcanicus]QDT39675.1 hypothetical protein Pan189_40840 [Stratiformator vulcanicus]